MGKGEPGSGAGSWAVVFDDATRAGPVALYAAVLQHAMPRPVGFGPGVRVKTAPCPRQSLPTAVKSRVGRMCMPCQPCHTQLSPCSALCSWLSASRPESKESQLLATINPADGSSVPIASYACCDDAPPTLAPLEYRCSALDVHHLGTVSTALVPLTCTTWVP